MKNPKLRQIERKKSNSGSIGLENHPSTETNLPDAKFIDNAGEESALFPIVAIGASAGGVEALQRLFKSMPADSGRAYIVVVHLAPDHSSRLAEIGKQHLTVGDSSSGRHRCQA